MGIFNKKPKAAKQPVASPAGKITKTELGNDLTALEGKLPEGFDPTNKDQVKALVESALKGAGLLPQDANIQSMEMVKVGDGDPEKLQESLKQVLASQLKGGGRKQYGSLKEVITAFNAMKSDPPHAIPAPADPAKAAFVNALNCLHKQTHALGPMVADLYQAYSCLELTMKACSPSAKEKARFKSFERRLIAMIEKMSEFGCEVCEVAELTERAGIPGPDSPAVVN